MYWRMILSIPRCAEAWEDREQLGDPEARI